MKLKKIINFGTIFATMSLVSTPVVSFAETADEILNIKNNINETKDNTLAPESENNTVNTTVPSNSEVENSQDSSVLPDEKIASPEEKISEKSIGIPNVEFNNDVPTSYIPSSTGISFTWNLNTIKDTQEIKQGDKIVLNISGEGLDYSTIRFASGGSSDPYFDLVIDEKNGQILLVAKQDVNFNGNISVSITGRPTGVEGPLDFPFTSSYISSEITSELLAENMVLHVKNSGGSWAIVGTPVTPGVNWNALEADGHGLYQPNNNGTGLPGKFYYTQNAQNWFAGIFNGKYNNISGSGPYIFTVESNYPIDTDSLKISGGKIGEMHDASTEYSTQWSDDNKVLSIVFNELTSSGSMGSAIAADFYVLTNTINDTVSIKTSAVDANGVSIGTGSNGVGTYYPTNSGSFLPFITAKDATVYTTDAPIDLLGLAEAYDQIDGDITDNIKIINNGGFDQSKPGEYKINYQVINSKGESAEYTNLVTVKENKSSIKGHDSTIYVGEKWTASDNFDSALDKDGNEVDFSKITVSGEVDTTKPGEYPITYSYEGISTTITVTVKENKSSIKGHDSTIYVGEKWTASDNFDSALDKDGNEIDFSKITVSGEVDTTKPGEYPITYSYEGISTAITVTVKENKSSIKGHDSTIYVGEKWTASDNFDSALDKDGNEIDFSKITVSGEVDTTKPGEYPITYSYEGISTTITVTVKENKSSIKGHDSTIYVGEKWTASDNFDSALDKDGNEIDFSKITVSGEVDTTKPGEYPITYSYEGISTAITVTVKENKSSIKGHDSTIYVGEKWTASDNFDSALDKDGNEIDFSKITVSGEVDTTKPGEYPITYSYEGISTTITVTVKENKSSIKGHDSTIYVGEKWTASDNFDSALDKDGNEIDFSKITVSGEVDTTKPGEYPITYSYEGISTTITVTVKENKSSIKGHDSTIYVGEKWTASDNFDSALDKDGNEIDFSKITVSGEVDTTKPGEYPITYSYEGISTTITVTVKEKKHDNESIIIVQYVDEKGNKIADDTIIRGKIGDKYETKAKKIDGYILKEEPENKNGKFVNTLTNIKYIYTNRSDATDKNKDIDTNKKIFKNEKLHSSKTYKTLPKTNEDYSVGSTILGVVILLGTTFVWFFRSKK